VAELGQCQWEPEYRKLLLANTSRVPAVIQLIPREWSMHTGSETRRTCRLDTPYAVNVAHAVAAGCTVATATLGVLTAIDMTTGKKSLGSATGQHEGPRSFRCGSNVGVPNSGGSMTTCERAHLYWGRGRGGGAGGP